MYATKIIEIGNHLVIKVTRSSKLFKIAIYNTNTTPKTIIFEMREQRQDLVEDFVSAFELVSNYIWKLEVTQETLLEECLKLQEILKESKEMIKEEK